ncbi:putative LPS assembly protein LptD [Chitinophaga nivalis]|uniref:LPS assembly protein LptD n=1 Tax=Chitinophaga nivalis TaxID=2991709 RepID=A0ABT3IPS2_9BACT|nr:putative LPS assembly protein LptD [Chitinophaga nivalis]MCW3464356.1 putative LPS assembly protein LptD [Chitinophaga nivalis]MCW3485953.1 putative LPS assembly protein LptD [Chitinophaga nivalis]
MSSSYKNNYKKFFRHTYLTFAGVVIAVPFIIDAFAGNTPHASLVFNKTLADTVPLVPKDSSKRIAPKGLPAKGADSTVLLPGADTAGLVKVDTLFVPKVSKDTLDAPVTYKAKDSIILMVPDKRFYLYGTATTKYKSIDLSAEKMNFDQETGVLEATNAKDTAGKVYGRPVMNDGGQSFESDTLRYNFSSQKAKIYNTRSQYGEGYIHSEQTKKGADNSIFGFRNGYTTCNLDTPHFSFRSRKIKVIPDKLVISGPANLEIEGIPTPLFIPFAIFPITQGQRSGILPPQYVVNQQKGMGLENGGYYFGMGEHMDLTLRGDVYSYGSWSLTASPTYRKRYKYNGGLNLSIANTRFGDPSVKSEFSSSRDFRVTWNHSMDSKARPGVNFGANVNFGTSTYNRYNVFDYNARVNNTIGSSISFSKNWQGKPYNLTVGLTHGQNLSTRDVNITFPDATFTVNTIYPFQPKELIGKPKWYHKLGVSYTTSLRNQANFKDSLFGSKAMLDAMQSGMQHTVPISFSIPVLKTLTFSPSINYTEYWYTKKFVRKWDPNKWNPGLNQLGAIDTSYIPGFSATRDVSFSASLSTAIYGMYAFSKHSKVKAIRHVARPTLSATYRPDLNSKNYYDLQYNKAGDRQRVSYYEGVSGFGVPAEGAFGGINFGLDNNLEMKVFSRKDTSGNHEKKIKLLDGFGITGSYNLVADSFKLSPFNIYARTNLFDKLNISMSGSIDPYQVDARGKRLDKFVWQQGKISLGRLTNASISMSTSFQSKDKKGKEKKIDSIENIQNGDAAFAAQQRQLQMVRNNPGEYVDFDIPWRVDLSYSLSYTNTIMPDSGGVVNRITQYVSFNGDFSLTPKWKIGLNSGFDFTNMQVAYTNMYISRDLHCWQMSINLIPFGTFRQFSITINPKAGILRDLRINRSRQFYDL